MASETIKLPKKLYVTFQQRKKEDPRLGFMSPYEKNSAFEKRKVTQDSWAYGYTIKDAPKFTIQDDDSVISTGGDSSLPFLLNTFPKVFPNTPMEGFELSKTIRRSGSWSGTNTVWRVFDPRGFELEIKSDNLMKILDHCVLDHGKILGKCCWGRSGADNILLPEDSDLYKNALSLTQKLGQKFSIRNLQIGDEVEILNTTFIGKKMIYLGSFHAYSLGKSSRFNEAVALDIFKGYDTLTSFFENEGGNLVSIKAVKVGGVTQPKKRQLTEDQAFEYIMEIINRNQPNNIIGIDKLLFISKKKVDPTLITQSFGDITGQEIIDRKYHAQYSSGLFCDYEGKFCLLRRSWNSMKNIYEDNLYQILKNELVESGRIKFVVDPSSYYGHMGGSRSTFMLPTNGIASLNFKTWTIKYPGIKRNLLDLWYI